MRRWSRAEDEALEEHAHLGARRCSIALFEATGHLRSASAVVMRAHRLGISMQVYEICAEYGREVPRLVEITGLCPLCHEREMTARSRRVRESLEQVATREEAAAITAARRERTTERKRKQRAREKAVKASYGDFVDTKIEKKTPRSKGQEILQTSLDLGEKE